MAGTAGLSDELIAQIQNTPKGLRADPATYMRPEAIEGHLAQFDEGASRFMSQSNLDKYGIAQRDGTAFVMPAREADNLLATANGNMRAMEQSLGLPERFLESNQLVRIDVPRPRELGLRVPSGNEAGANELWIPGGRLPTGNLEAVIDAGGIAADRFVRTPVGGAYSSAIVGVNKALLPGGREFVGPLTAIDSKILFGASKPGTNDIIGGHSPDVLKSPLYEINPNQVVNPDGTISVTGFKATIVRKDGMIGLSKAKSPNIHTIAPLSWDNVDILQAGQATANVPGIVLRNVDGVEATLHTSFVNGVEWQVIKENGVVMSSFPTGGRPIVPKGK